MDNFSIFQFFEWNVPNDGAHWERLRTEARSLAEMGVGAVWIPPCCKGAEQNSVGYDVYDLFDLGEFDQKGTVRTKYGTRAQLEAAIAEAHRQGIRVIADAVLNHKAGADATERFQAVEVDPNDRNRVLSQPFDIEGWTDFGFAGRGGCYSPFHWHYSHFNAVDRDELSKRCGIFKVYGEGKNWAADVDSEKGNYDYLMGADIDYHNADVVEEIKRWALWFAQTFQIDGFRMDAVKHIEQSFVKLLIEHVRLNLRRDFFVVGEYWNADEARLNRFIDESDQEIQLFDVSLHYRFAEAGHKGRDYDLTHLFDQTLVSTNPFRAVTFVDNHDSQPGESLESWVEDWFKPLAYALILLRRDGLPCVFYGDYYGIGGGPAAKKALLDPLLLARKQLAYGEEIDYFDHPNVIGFLRLGDAEHPRSGLAVLVSNGDEVTKRMAFGKARAGQVFADRTGNRTERITLDGDGAATFTVNGGSVSVWAEVTEA
ncbi:MAG TPA: alpha-amylase [Candidatus Limiplasma sp.]|nr:alpha-amylase [Candidatus Limiplasma sp.]HPS81050.1 alpha-amylase [Candidatus Limiplasma sp.]